MSTREAIRAAYGAGTFFETTAATPHAQFDSVAEILSELHNDGEINVLTACATPGLDALSRHSFFCFQQIFCRTLPKIHCSTDDAIAACGRMFDRAGADAAAGFIYDALVQWFQESPARVDGGLALIRQEMGISSDVVRSVLLAGATHNAAKATTDALDLSNREDPTIRLPAIWALARVLTADDERLRLLVLRRFTEVVSVPLSERDTAAALDSALHLYRRVGASIADPIAVLLTKACTSSTEILRQTLAYGLSVGLDVYSDTMIDTILPALQKTQGCETHTIQMLDSVLYQWDLDGDRERVLAFLINLLGQEDATFDLEALQSFQQRLSNGPGGLLGWYVVSLLLTGSHRRCEAAVRLLPHKEARAGLDVDLSSFSLSASWVLFLARRILGYCLFKKASATALLLSCLRVVPEQHRQELEDLVLDHFLMNYLGALDSFEATIPADDPAKESIDRLSLRLRAYLAELDRSGPCAAFKPTERERQLQGYRLHDFGRDVQKEAEEKSVLLQLVSKATLLYGTASVVYVHTDAGSEPARQELPLSTFSHAVEWPRLHRLDPVGLQRDIVQFRSESPPG